MPTEHVLVELTEPRDDAFAAFEAACGSPDEAANQSERLLARLAGYGVALDDEPFPVPMFIPPRASFPSAELVGAMRAFGAPTMNPDMSAVSTVVPVAVDRTRLDEIRQLDHIAVWPNSALSLLPSGPASERTIGPVVDDPVIDAARSRPGVACQPFDNAVSVATIRELLGTDRVWTDGFRGQGVTVAILDEGIDGSVYPVSGGFSRPGARAPGTAAITSHGSMCAADVLVAAPWARLSDYPFLGQPRSGGAIAMFQAVLDQRRLDGTPQVTNNSYGFTGVPPKEQFPGHEVHDPDHPLHRKVREVVASGVVTFFAAGNCGEECPSGNCDASGIGPGRSIHGTNSIAEVITVAAVDARHRRLGYSSQGPGMFASDKPDLAAYSHFFGNFGPGRPGDLESPFDNGTSAASPVAAGVAALLLSADDGITPEAMRALLVEGATRVTMGTDAGDAWHPGYGRGVVNAAASYSLLLRAAQGENGQ